MKKKPYGENLTRSHAEVESWLKSLRDLAGQRRTAWAGILKGEKIIASQPKGTRGRS